MKLSDLVFECVRDSITLPNPNISKTQFINDLVGGSPIGKDWELQVSGVFSALNLGLSRLNDSNKIPFLIKMDEVVDKGIVTISDGYPVNIVKFGTDGNYESLCFRTLSNGKCFVCGVAVTEKMEDETDDKYKKRAPKVLVEYRQELPHFNTYSLKEIGDTDTNDDLLSKYGISNNMCDYLKEFVKGQLLEYVSPELANMHNNRAEQYFSLIPTVSEHFPQTHIANVQQEWL